MSYFLTDLKNTELNKSIDFYTSNYQEEGIFTYEIRHKSEQEKDFSTYIGDIMAHDTFSH